jgi:hypothetical protein
MPNAAGRIVSIGGPVLYFRIRGPQRVGELVEPDDVTSLHAVCPTGLGQEELLGQPFKEGE